MNKNKEKIQTMFGWLFQPWTDANDDSYASQKTGSGSTGISLIWDWDAGTPSGDLPFKYIPRTIKDIFRVKKNYSLISKLKTVNTMCIKPLLRRQLHWTSNFGSCNGGEFYTFDWLTLKVNYSNSSWAFDTYQQTNFYERYIWDKNFRVVRSEYFYHGIAEKRRREISEDEHDLGVEKLQREYEERMEDYDDE